MRYLIFSSVLLIFLSSCGMAQAEADPALETEDQKTLYALGLAVSRNLSSFDPSEEDLNIILMGIRDGVLGNEEQASFETYAPKIEALVRARIEAAAERLREEGKVYLAEMETAEGAVKTESGLIYFDEQMGEGESPTNSDRVRLHYKGTFPDGKEFDSSGAEPAEFSLTGVNDCFAEGVTTMNVGGKRKLVCPPEIAYGDQGFPPAIPPGATIVFDVELLDIIRPEAPTSDATSDSNEEEGS